MPLPIHLLPSSSKVLLDHVERASPGPIVACDFYIEGAEQWASTTGGWQRGRTVNVDHHAPVAEYQRFVSSANLALERIAAEGMPAEGSTIVINHTDADSILSAGVLAGVLPVDERIGRAAIAADHTGAEVRLADVLQGLFDARDVELSLACARAVLEDAPLPAAGILALERQERERAQAKALVAEGRMNVIGFVTCVELDEAIDGAHFPALLPEAVVIMVSAPHAGSAEVRDIKLRLGLGAPAGMSLQHIGISTFDTRFGGRWNAGSNKRGGGTSIGTLEYAARLQDCVTRSLSANPWSPPE